MTETWRAIADFPGYEVSDCGRVRSVERVLFNGRGHWTHLGQVIAPHTTPKGYQAVGLHRGGKYSRQLVHRLVYAAFNGSCVGRQVRHWPDRDPAHNTPDNLAVDTNSDNQRDSVQHGTHRSARKTKCKREHPFDEANTHHYINAKGRPARACRRCRADAARKRRRNQ